MAPRGGTRTWEGGPRARRPGARSLLECLEGLGREEVISATCELGLCKWEEENRGLSKMPSQVREFVEIVLS